NRHTFDQDERIAFHDHAVGEGCGVALVRVADDVFAVSYGVMHRLPLDAGREALTASTAQTGIGDGLDDVSGCNCDCLFKAAQSAMGTVVFQRQRIDYAAALKGEPCLLGKEGQILDPAERQAMRAACEEASIK